MFLKSALSLTFNDVQLYPYVRTWRLKHTYSSDQLEKDTTL